MISVHCVVSFDFACRYRPGWHATIFPPYFVAGAIYAGFAMVLTLSIPLRSFYGLEDFITMRHIDNMAKITLATGLIVAYGYLMEAFMAWYSGSPYEEYMVLQPLARALSGPVLGFASCVTSSSFNYSGLSRVRKSTLALWIISLVVGVGMWLERFFIIVTSLSRDHLPSSWDMYYPTVYDWSMYIGTIGFFCTLLFLFLRFLPMISIFEMRTIVPQTGTTVKH